MTILELALEIRQYWQLLTYYSPTTDLLPNYYRPTTDLLPAYYRLTTGLIPTYTDLLLTTDLHRLTTYYLLTTVLLLSYYQLTPTYYWLTTDLLLTYYRHTTDIHRLTTDLLPIHYWRTTDLLPPYYWHAPWNTQTLLPINIIQNTRTPYCIQSVSLFPNPRTVHLIAGLSTAQPALLPFVLRHFSYDRVLL